MNKIKQNKKEQLLRQADLLLGRLHSLVVSMQKLGIRVSEQEVEQDVRESVRKLKLQIEES